MTRSSSIVTRSMVALCATVVTCTVAAWWASAAPPPPPPNYGINGATRGIDDNYAKAKAAGFGWVRVFFNWYRIETAMNACTTSPAGGVNGNCKWDQQVLMPRCGGTGCTSFSWESVAQSPDELVNEAYNNNVRVVVVLWGTPQWSSGGTGNPDADAALMPRPLDAQNDIDDYGKFAAAAVARYGAKVAAWELWGEPNIPDNWAPNASTADRVGGYQNRILKPGFDRIKAVSPTARVAAPNVSRGANAPAPSDFGTWVRNSGTQGDVVRQLDILSFDSYDSVANIETDIDNANRFAQNNFTAAKAWLMEFGWSTTQGGDGNGGCNGTTPCVATCPDETTCGNRIVSIFNLMGDSRYPLFERAFVFHLHDRTRSTCVRGCRYGLLDDTGAAKGRYNVVKQALNP